MNDSKINYPIGFIGPLEKGKQYIEEKLLSTDDIMILDSKASIDEIKELGVFLLHRGFNRRVGIIYSLNKWKANYQAVLLKLFEQIPEYNSVFYTASFTPSVVVQTRSQIWRLPPIKDERLEHLMLQILDAMKGNYDVCELMSAFKIAAQVQSWVDDGVIDVRQQAIILKSIGV